MLAKAIPNSAMENQLKACDRKSSEYSRSMNKIIPIVSNCDSKCLKALIFQFVAQIDAFEFLYKVVQDKNIIKPSKLLLL